MNAAIRQDKAEDMIHVSMVARAMNQRVVATRDNAEGRDALNQAWQKFPPDGVVYRGGGFNNQYQDFFVVGKQYRVPGFLATSFKRKTAIEFITRVRGKTARVLWHISVDPRGRDDPLFRCKHAVLLTQTHVKDEMEYLFTAYSTFTVESVTWSTNYTQPHEIKLLAANDNLTPDVDLPLAPWY